MRLVMAVEGESTTRAAQSLAVHPGVDEVALLAPTTSRQFQTVESALGFDAVVGAGKAASIADRAGIPAIVTGALHAQPGVAWASVEGVAFALLEGDAGRPAVAIEGEPGGETPIVFPSPIDSRTAEEEFIDGRSLLVARGAGPLAAAMVLEPNRHRVILDDQAFLRGVALAAGVGLLLDGPVDVPVPVWERAAAYLKTASDMGLVIGERPAEES